MSLIAGYMVPHPPLIVPAIGKGSEAQVADTIAAYEKVAQRIAALDPDTENYRRHGMDKAVV